jgi:hypothetical protein
MEQRRRRRRLEPHRPHPWYPRPCHRRSPRPWPRQRRSRPCCRLGPRPCCRLQRRPGPRQRRPRLRHYPRRPRLHHRRPRRPGCRATIHCCKRRRSPRERPRERVPSIFGGSCVSLSSNETLLDAGIPRDLDCADHQPWVLRAVNGKCAGSPRCNRLETTAAQTWRKRRWPVPPPRQGCTKAVGARSLSLRAILLRPSARKPPFQADRAPG